MTEPELDPKLAAKLRAAAEHEPYAVLDDQARARVVRALQSKPRSKRFPWVNVSMAVAAAALFALMLRPAAPACQLPTDSSFAQGTLDLGQFGRVVLDPEADARVSKTEACELEITLERGALAAALHDLKPGRLTVRTPLGAVEVRGTTFSVAVGSELEVVLLEGAVALHHDDVTTNLAPRRALTRTRSGAPRTTTIAPAQERRLRKLLEPALPAATAPVAAVKEQPQEAQQEAARAVVPEPAKITRSATELLAAAERERRAGQLDEARALYREAGSAAGPDAEVALLRWARLELDEQPQAALDVLTRYRARYARRARLGAEAMFLEVQVLDKLGRRDEARQRARELVRRYPDSPHARAASAW